MKPFPVRRFPWPETPALPVHWFGGSALLSHRVNGLHMVFPSGERFFIRSVRDLADALDDPSAREAVRTFAAQEAQHGRAHEQAFDALRAQGFEIDSWIDWYERTAYAYVEDVSSPVLRLATTAALEHITATLATDALSTDLLDDAHELMASLLRWHACEEIEHKALAFDVLQAADDRWSVRAAGMIVALVTLIGFSGSATRHLLRQDPEATRSRVLREVPGVLAKLSGRGLFRRLVVDYLRPGFHPDAVDNRGLAEAWLERNPVASAVG